MREERYRWYGADGSAHFKLVEIPDAAQRLIGCDIYSREVWEGDIVRYVYDLRGPLTHQATATDADNLKKGVVVKCC